MPRSLKRVRCFVAYHSKFESPIQFIHFLFRKCVCVGVRPPLIILLGNKAKDADSWHATYFPLAREQVPLSKRCADKKSTISCWYGYRSAAYVKITNIETKHNVYPGNGLRMWTFRPWPIKNEPPIRTAWKNAWSSEATSARSRLSTSLHYNKQNAHQPYA